MARLANGWTWAALTVVLMATRGAMAQPPRHTLSPGWGPAGYPGYPPLTPYGFGYGYGLGVGIALGNPYRGGYPGAKYVVYSGPPYVPVAPNSLGLPVPPIYVESDGPPRPLPRIRVLPFPTPEPGVTPLPPPRPLTEGAPRSF